MSVIVELVIIGAQRGLNHRQEAPQYAVLIGIDNVIKQRMNAFDSFQGFGFAARM